MTLEMMVSERKINNVKRAEMITTITVELINFSLSGQTTFFISTRTSSINCLAFLIITSPAFFNKKSSIGCKMQAWRDSNPQPPVLETGALAN